VKPSKSTIASAAAAALVLTTTTALAGSGVGGVFNLGQVNTVDTQTSLTGNPGGSPLLKVTSNGTAAAVRGVATNGIGTNGVSTSGVGQQGLSDSGIGTLRTHGNTTGISPGVQGETNSIDPNGAGVVGKNNGGGPGLKAIVNAGAPPLSVNSSVKVANLNADLMDGFDSLAFQKRVTGTCGAGSAIKTVNADGTVVCEPVGVGGVWSLTGNSGTTPGTNFLGTSDNAALELKVNGQRALRLEPNATSPNLIGGSSGNSVDAGQFGSVIAGGGTPSPAGGNHAENSFNFIGAGYGNQAGASGGSGASAVVAGTANVASGGLAFIGAGNNNTASGDYSVVAGGNSNTASVYESTVGGGMANAAGLIATVGGGKQNSASGPNSTVGGGYLNNASNTNDTVGGGQGNQASGSSSTVAGGYSNTASGGAATVPGGSGNTASGGYSFAAGTQAKATQNGSFVWGDSTVSDLTSPAANTFTVRASGGIWLGTNSSPAITTGHFIDTSTGAYLSSAGAWTNASDQALKHGFRPLDKQDVLERVARMPITNWSYKAEKPSVRHIGPMAQNFYKAFRLGLDDKHITTIDEGGVALAAIQGLYSQNQRLDRDNRALERRVRLLEQQLQSGEGRRGR
jgi:Chaperone of endosialidase